MHRNARRGRGVWLFACLGLLSVMPSTAAALPLISEIFYDAVGSDDGKSFVEIAGLPGTSLDGFTLEGVNGSNGAVGPVVVLSGVIGSDGLFVVADSTSEGTSDVLEADLLQNFDFQNGPDSILLTDGAQVIDAVGYGDFDPDEVFAGEGLPAEDPAAGWSVARLLADVDTDDNSLDFVSLEVPTPGTAQFQTVPEPSTGLLAFTGLGLVAYLRRPSARKS